MAELGAKGASKRAILEAHAIEDAYWIAAGKHWGAAIAEETKNGKRELLQRYDDVYIATATKQKPIGATDYAMVLVGVERGDVARALAKVDLQLTDLVRLQRVWSKKTADDPKLKAELDKAVALARKAKP
jgi:hypothetical protein